MKVADALQGVVYLFLDTAPVIYYVENNPRYLSIVQVVFDRIDDGSLNAVTSPVTLAESLVVPFRSGAGHFLTNDIALKRVAELRILVVDELAVCRRETLSAPVNLCYTRTYE